MHPTSRRLARRALFVALPAAVALSGLPALPAVPGAAPTAAEPADVADPAIPFIDGILRNVSASDERSNNPAVATDLDDTYLAWREDGRVAFTAVRDRGTSEDATTVFDAADPGGRLTVAQPGLATVGDHVWVTWSEEVGDHGSVEVFVAHSSDRGRTFSAPEQLSSADTKNAYDPRIDATAEVVGVVWDGDDGLELATLERTLGFDQWLRQPLGGNTTNGDYDIVATGDTVHVAWAGAGIQTRRAVDGGTRLEAVVQVSPPRRGARDPHIDAAGADVAIGWFEDNWQNPDPFQYRVGDSLDGGATFTNTLVGEIVGSRLGVSCICAGPLVAVGVGRTFAVFDLEGEGGLRQVTLENGALLSNTGIGAAGDGPGVFAEASDLAVTGAGVFVSYERYGVESGHWEIHTAARRHGSGDWLLRLAFDRTHAWGSALAPLGEGDYVVTLVGYDLDSAIEDVYLAPFSFAGARDLEPLVMGPVQGPEEATTLVAGRQTAFRVVLRNSLFTTLGVTLRWELASGDLGTATPAVFDQRVMVRPGRNEVWFTPPGSYRPDAGELHAELSVDPDGEHREDDEANNSLDATLPVVDTEPFDVLYVPLSTDDEVTVPCETVELVEANGEAYLDGAYPIDERESLSVPSCATTVQVSGRSTLSDRRPLAAMIHDALAQLGHLTDLYDAVVIVTPEDWIQDHVEEINESGSERTRGVADYGTRPGIVFVDQVAFSGWAVAHEIAHDHGWVLEASGRAGQHLSGVPAPGYWVQRARDVDLIDFMNPSGTPGSELTRWISPATWDHLLGELTVAAPAAELAASSTATTSITVSGVLADDGTITSSRVERGEQPATVEPGGTGEVEAVLLDADGQELGRAALPLGEASHAGSGGERAFHGRLPEPSGTAAVAVVVDGEEVLRHERSATPPTVELLTPASGAATSTGSTVGVSWSTSDADGNPLVARVDVSTDDGATWRPVRAGIEGDAVDAPVTPELTGAVRYRVTVSDGWDTATAVSDPVTVAATAANGRIAYRSGRSITAASAPTLRTVGDDGSDDRLVAALSSNGFARDVRDPSWSPDGLRLALTEAGEDVIVVGADGSGLQRLGLRERFSDARGENRSMFSCPVWSPDGARLAVIATGYGIAGAGLLGSRLVVVGVDGSDPTVAVELATGVAGLQCGGSRGGFTEGSGGLSWTTDDRIWFRGPGADMVLESVRPDGTDRRVGHTIPNGPSNDPRAFDVRPDGAAIAYTDDLGPKLELFVVPLSGGAPRQVTDLPNDATTSPQLGRVEWSPDGRMVAAEVYDDRRPFPRTIDVFDVLSGERRSVVGGAGEAEATSPSWQVVPAAEPPPSAPQIRASMADPLPTPEGATVTLDASGSTAEAGPASFAWDLDGDGAFDDADGTTVDTAFPDEGTYVVAVEVRDALGQVDVARAEVVVTNAAPSITAAVAAERHGVVTVDVDVREPSVDDLVATVVWGDGTEEQAVAARGTDGAWAVVATRAAEDAGSGATVRVVDGDGGEATAEVAVAVVANRPPTAQPVTVETDGAAVEVDVVAVDPDGDRVGLALVTPPAAGEVDILGGVGDDGRPLVRYRPAVGSSGTYTFEMVATDGFASSAPAVVTVAVTGADEPTPTTTPPTTPPGPGPGPTPAPPVGQEPLTDTGACPADRVPAPAFVDVPETSTHRPAIACATWWAIAHGRSTDEFDPLGTLTRGQMASFLARLVDATAVELPTDVPDAFSDDDGVHEAAIDRLAAAGIAHGVGDGRFGPQQQVTRAQLASLLAGVWAFVAGEPLADGPDAFGDDDGTVHEAAIDAVAAAGIAHGVAVGGFAPADPVRRDQMASFLVRVLDLAVEDGTATPPA